MWLEVKQPTDAIVWLAAGSLLGKPILRLRRQPSSLKRFVGHLEGSAITKAKKLNIF